MVNEERKNKRLKIEKRENQTLNKSQDKRADSKVTKEEERRLGKERGEERFWKDEPRGESVPRDEGVDKERRGDFQRGGD